MINANLQGMNNSNTNNQRIAKMSFASVYPMYLAKVEKKGRTKEELQNGVELKCELHFENTEPYEIEYIYINGILKLKKEWSTGPISEYYIIPKDFLKQTNIEFERILKKNQ